ncbi:MAG: toxin-antitoxin system YwqK family antitoxin [Mucilaginibacter sp.]
MKLLSTFTLCVLAATCSFSQSAHTIYLKPDGSKTTHSDSANSYIMYGKENDSLWFMRQYGMDNMIMTSGYYADEAMLIPHGKFTYYQYHGDLASINYDFEKRRYDTVKYNASNYIAKIGYYVNGKRQGKWQVYNEYGKLYEIFFYQNDKVSGPARFYADDGKQILEEGNLKDDMKDGNWNFYSPKGALMGVIRYYKGQRQGIRSHLNSKELSVKNGMPDYDLAAYLTGALKSRKLSTSRHCYITYSFHLNKNGTLTQPEIYRSGCDIELCVAIGEIMLNAPAWDAAIKNKQPVDATAVMFLQILFDADKKPHVTFNTSNQDDNIYVLSPDY